MSRFIRPALVNLLRLLGGLLFLLGVVSFLLGPQHGTSSYDYTQTLTEPQPICGGRLQTENGKIYLFNEELCSVNVYTENGDFLFCVRGSRFQNGQADFAVVEDLGIFIEGRNHVLYRFDEQNGAYRGRVENSAIYDASGNFRMQTQGTAVLFDDNWYCFQQYNEGKECREFWFCGPRGTEYLGTEADFRTAEAEEASGSAHYFAFLNSLYADRDGEIQRLASTPLYLTVFYSPFLAWAIGIAGMLIQKLADSLDRLIQRWIQKKAD